MNKATDQQVFGGNCDECLYFDPRWNKGLLGYCRYAPPVIIAAANPDEFGDDRVRPATLFPTVNYNDWCGQFIMTSGDDQWERDNAAAGSDKPSEIPLRDLVERAGVTAPRSGG